MVLNVSVQVSCEGVVKAIVAFWVLNLNWDSKCLALSGLQAVEIEHINFFGVTFLKNFVGPVNREIFLLSENVVSTALLFTVLHR